MVSVISNGARTSVSWTDFDDREVTREFVNAADAERFAGRLRPVLEQSRRDGYVFIEGGPEFDVDHPAAWSMAYQHLVEVLMRTFPGLDFELEITPAENGDALPREGSLSWRVVPAKEALS